MTAGQINMKEARRRHVLRTGRTNTRCALFSAEQSGKVSTKGARDSLSRYSMLYCTGIGTARSSETTGPSR